MYYIQQNLSERITYSNEAINLTETDSTLGESLKEFGITPERLEVGKGYVADVSRLINRQQVEYGIRIETTEAVNDLFKEVRSRLSLDRQMIRYELNANPGILERLNLRGPTASSREALLLQARHVYSEVLADEAVFATIAPQLNADMITARLALVEEFAAAMETQQRQRADAKLSTQARRDAMKRLDTWMGDFIRIARVAFRDNPGQLEKLGIKVKR